MVFDITQLKKIRKQIGLTQFQFAKEAGISQSMIAKIEAGRLDPTYSKVKLIENALENLTKSHEKTAIEIMNKKMISINPIEKVKEIIKLMNKHGISQIPVIKKNKIIGLVSEFSILSRDIEEIKELSAEEIMENPPPIINHKTEMSVIKQLLKFYPIVLVEKRGKFVGVVTKSDFIDALA